MQHLALGSGAEKFKEANIVDNTVRPELSKMGVMNPRRVFKLKKPSTPAESAPVEPTPAAPAPVESAPKKVFKLKKSEVKEPEVSGKDRLLAEVKKNAADVLSYAKSGASSSDVLKRWNSSVGPKLDLYGAEYLPYGAASEMSDEMFEKIQEVLSATKKKEDEDYDRKYKEGRDEIVKYAKEFGEKKSRNKEIDAYIAKMKSVPVDEQDSKRMGKTIHTHPNDLVSEIKGWIHDNYNTFGQKPRDEIKKLYDDMPSYFEKMSKTKAIKAYKKVIAYLKTLRK